MCTICFSNWKWRLSWWAWTDCDMQQKVLCSEEKEWHATAGPQLQLGHPVHLARCNLLQTVIHQHLRLLLFVTQTSVFLWTWQWNYKTYIPHCLLYCCTVYLSQCVNQDCQHTAAESQSNHTEVTLQNRKRDLPTLGFEGQFFFQLLRFGSWQCLNGCGETIIVGIPFSPTVFSSKRCLGHTGYILHFNFYIFPVSANVCKAL